MTEHPDRALEALQRLLADARAGGQAKVDALVALAQRTVLVPTWGPGDEAFRTLVNSKGDTALPIFTARPQLLEAATHFGWQLPGEETPSKEIGARRALRHAIAHELSFVVVDITASHSLEIERTEIEPLLEQSPRHGSGPYAGVGKLSSSMLRAVKPTPHPEPVAPGADIAVPKPPRTPDDAGAIAGLDTGATEHHLTAPAPGALQLLPLRELPPDELLDSLSTVLRGYPEVEWAAFAAASRESSEPAPAVGLRVDETYRARLDEIAAALHHASAPHGLRLDILLLDDAELIRTARTNAVVFYPWRRR